MNETYIIAMLFAYILGLLTAMIILRPRDTRM